MELTLIDLLKAVNGYVVGGAVRDIYLGRVPHDYDVVTTLTPDEIRERVEITHSIGEKFGTLCVNTVDAGVVEVTTARCDITKGRKPEVCWTDDITEDLKRRDFTINALIMGADGLIQGLAMYSNDLDDKLIRCVGNPKDRLDEDSLRALRALRFSMQLDFTIAKDLDEILHSFDLKIGEELSPNRVMDELRKMFAIHPSRAIRILDEYNFLQQIFPEICMLHGCEHDPKHHPEGDAFEHTMLALDSCPSKNFATQLCVLFHDVGKPLTRCGTHYYGHDNVGARTMLFIAERMSFSNELRDAIAFCCANHMKMHRIEEMRAIKRREIYDSKYFPKLLMTAIADQCNPAVPFGSRVQWIIRDRADMLFNNPEPLINGHDIMALGYKGKVIGVIKEACFAAQLEGTIKTKEGAIAWVKAWR